MEMSQGSKWWKNNVETEEDLTEASDETKDIVESVSKHYLFLLYTVNSVQGKRRNTIQL